MCRALIVVMQSLSKDALGESIGFNLEETTFEQFRRPDLKLLSQSSNHRTNAELYANLLGYLANSRFISVTDRFLAELSPVASGHVAKDVDLRYENLVRGLKHIQIKVGYTSSDRFCLLTQLKSQGLASGIFRRRRRVYGGTSKGVRERTWIPLQTLFHGDSG
jgi:Cell morphogenesis N-terminal